MSISPIATARVSNLLKANVATTSINGTEASLLDIQNQLSTGKRINLPSDDPGGAAIVQQLQKTLEKRQGYLSNLQNAQSNLGEVDSSLSDLTDILRQAQTLASADVGSDVTDSQRANDAIVIQSLYSQAINIANKQFNGTYLFGGDANTSPYTQTAGGVRFDGGDTLLNNQFDENTTLAYNVQPSTVFGAYSQPTSTSADLAPAATLATRLSDLRGATGNGIQLSSLNLSNGVIIVSTGIVTKNVDLSSADSLQDVVTLINNAGTGITASVTATGLALAGNPGDNITVTDTGSGTAASDLGIATAGAGQNLNGQPLSPKVTALTHLSDLLGGAGLDTTGGLTLSNGTQSVNVDFTGAVTVQDLLNKINASGIGALARINSAGNGVEIVNAVQGASLSVSENGGTVATALGVRSFNPSDSLASLNLGKGVNTVTGPEFRISARDGTGYPIDISGDVTVQDVINTINTTTGGSVTASFATTGNGIVLTDNTGSSAFPLGVTSLNFSSAAKDLGLSAPAVGSTLTGTDVKPVAASGIFGALQKLQTALSTSDTAGITASATDLQGALDQVVRTRGAVGARVQELEASQSRLEDQNTATKSLLSDTQDVDYTSAITKFQILQNALQANLQSTAKTLSLSLLDFLG